MIDRTTSWLLSNEGWKGRIKMEEQNEQQPLSKRRGRPRKPPVMEIFDDPGVLAYRTQRAAKILGVTYNALLALIHSGELKAVKMSKGKFGRYLIPKAAIDGY